MSVIKLGVGRPPKPTSIKELQGTARADRANPAEPRLAPAKLAARVPKEWVKGGQEEWAEAVAVWRYLARLVDPMSVATAADVEAFRGLVEDTALHRAHVRMARAAGLVVVDEGGGVREHPSGKAAATLRKLLLVQQARFGLSPSDRQRVSALAEAEGAEDPLAEFSADAGA